MKGAASTGSLPLGTAGGDGIGSGAFAAVVGVGLSDGAATGLGAGATAVDLIWVVSSLVK